jgi:magnesium-protoporphyrin O-methyltransferase
MADTASWRDRRSSLETYFNRTAVEAWSRLTSDAPVGRIRATVRAGRDEMRSTLLSWLPDDLRGKRILDAGCGTGALSVEAAQRGADVVAIDIAPNLIELARERLPSTLGEGRIDFRVGDMHDPALGEFDYVVAMDSLIHYQEADVAQVLANIAGRTRNAILFTFAPWTLPLATMHRVGKLFPKSDRSPAIVPLKQERLRHFANSNQFSGLQAKREKRVARGFYISQALELSRS